MTQARTQSKFSFPLSLQLPSSFIPFLSWTRGVRSKYSKEGFVGRTMYRKSLGVYYSLILHIKKACKEDSDNNELGNILWLINTLKDSSILKGYKNGKDILSHIYQFFQSIIIYSPNPPPPIQAFRKKYRCLSMPCFYTFFFLFPSIFLSSSPHPLLFISVLNVLLCTQEKLRRKHRVGWKKVKDK